MNKLRILIVDDNEAIHADFRKVFNMGATGSELDTIESVLFEQTPSHQPEAPEYIIDSAYQGAEAAQAVEQAKNKGEPYAMAFVDFRMPPGWDGVETIQHIWRIDSDIQIVICTAYADLRRDEIVQKLGNTDNLLILKKPFDSIEVLQLAATLTKKWELKLEIRHQIENMALLVKIRTSTLATILDSTQEGIIALSRNNEIMSHNKIFMNIWDASENCLKKNNAAVVFKKLADKVQDSVVFFNTIMQLCHSPKEQDAKEWELKNGKIIEITAKPLLIGRKIIGSVFSFRDISERKRMEKELVHQASHDGLTGLPNRLLLDDRGKQAIIQAKKHGFSVAIVLIDLDHFKYINDTLGHHVGDKLLKSVTKILLGCVEESDTISRFGGDEFVVILTNLSTEEAILRRANMLREALLKPYDIKHHKLTVTASCGVSIYPKHGNEFSTLLKNADAALFYAKSMGRNTVQVYANEFNEYTMARAELITALRFALERHELVLHYQPLIDLHTGKTRGVEALLRWNHPTLGFMQPDTFIPLAEESGLIVPIGEWVLRMACEQAKLWQQSINPELIMAVNISGLQFKQPHFVEMVARILKETHVANHLLELEITETVILGHTTEALNIMMALKEIGVRLAMDDFGTGYASLAYFKLFPFDKIKIDKCFIDNTPEDIENRTIVEAIMSMSAAMKFEVLAEGVETIEQVEFLRSIDVDQVQGYYFSRPLDAIKCTSFLQRDR